MTSDLIGDLIEEYGKHTPQLLVILIVLLIVSLIVYLDFTENQGESKAKICTCIPGIPLNVSLEGESKAKICTCIPGIPLNVSLDNVQYENIEGYMAFTNVPANYAMVMDDESSNNPYCNSVRDCDGVLEGIYWVVYNNDWNQRYKRSFFSATGEIYVLQFLIPTNAFSYTNTPIETPLGGFPVMLVDDTNYDNYVTFGKEASNG